MSSSAGRISIVTPIFFGDGTGASIYYQMLSRYLRAQGWRVQVISERTSAADPGAVDNYVPLFPFRSGRNRAWLRDSLAYGIQNLQYVRIINHIRHFNSTHTLIHSSFLNTPGFFYPVLKHLDATTGCSIDVRDVLLPPRVAPLLRSARSILACSENVVAMLKCYGLSEDRIAHVPVPFAHGAIADDLLEFYKKEFGPRYIVYVGMIRESKRVDTLIQAFTQYVLPRFPDVELVLAGRRKWSNPANDVLLRHPKVRHVGSISHHNTLHLIAGASVVVNPSAKESLGRSALEAISLQRPVVLPAEVPEFERAAPGLVASSAPNRLADQIASLLTTPTTVTYDLSVHSPPEVFAKFVDAIQKPFGSSG